MATHHIGDLRLGEIPAGRLLGHDDPVAHPARAITNGSAPLRPLPMPMSRSCWTSTSRTATWTSCVRGTKRSTWLFAHS